MTSAPVLPDPPRLAGALCYTRPPSTPTSPAARLGAAVLGCCARCRERGVTDQLAAEECCGEPILGEALADLAAERAERVARRRQQRAQVRAELNAARAAGLVLRKAQRFARIRDGEP